LTLRRTEPLAIDRVRPRVPGHIRAVFRPRDYRSRQGRVQVYGCSPGCLLASLALSLVLTLVLNGCLYLLR
jgi:hypothetical protein